MVYVRKPESCNRRMGWWRIQKYSFRTGALGQGSRTALPICGYFIQALMKDPEFKKYHGRFHKPDDEDITADMYNCSSYVPAKKRYDTD